MILRGFRIMARRDAAGVRLITRNGNDFTRRFPRSCVVLSLVNPVGAARWHFARGRQASFHEADKTALTLT